MATGLFLLLLLVVTSFLAYEAGNTPSWSLRWVLFFGSILLLALGVVVAVLALLTTVFSVAFGDDQIVLRRLFGRTVYDPQQLCEMVINFHFARGQHGLAVTPTYIQLTLHFENGSSLLLRPTTAGQPDDWVSMTNRQALVALRQQIMKKYPNLVIHIPRPPLLPQEKAARPLPVDPFVRRKPLPNDVSPEIVMITDRPELLSTDWHILEYDTTLTTGVFERGFGPLLPFVSLSRPIEGYQRFELTQLEQISPTGRYVALFNNHPHQLILLDLQRHKLYRWPTAVVNDVVFYGDNIQLRPGPEGKGVPTAVESVDQLELFTMAALP